MAESKQTRALAEILKLAEADMKRVGSEKWELLRAIRDLAREAAPVPRAKRCGGELQYETVGGMRVYDTGGQTGRFYRWRCPTCGQTGRNDGKDLACREPKQ